MLSVLCCLCGRFCSFVCCVFCVFCAHVFLLLEVQEKLWRAGGFAVEGARRAAPLLSLPWALGVRAVDAWRRGERSGVGCACCTWCRVDGLERNRGTFAWGGL